MGVNIEWQPVGNRWFDTSGMSYHAAILRRMFGNPDEGHEFILDSSLLERLRGLNLGDVQTPFWSEVIDAIEMRGAIRVRLVY